MKVRLHVLQATADVLAMASLEVDLSKIEVGQTITVKWRGKPVFIRHRSEDDIASANNVKLQELRDPQADDERVLNPEVSPTDWVCHEMCRLRAPFLLLVTVVEQRVCQLSCCYAGACFGPSHLTCSAVAGCGWRVHPPGVRAVARCRRLWRVVLPLSRKPL